MKLIVKVNKQAEYDAAKTYYVRLPNWFDVATLDDVMKKVELELPADEQIIEHLIYGDNSLTLEERKEVDIYGKVVSKYIELEIPDAG
jgi:hypothetical protein